MVEVTKSGEENDSQHRREVNYDKNPIKLYTLIESKTWDAVNARLKGYPDEASTWVTRYRKEGSLRWRMIALHAALCLSAPVETVVALIDAYPKGSLCTNDQGMLPIHLAIKYDADEKVIRKLLKAYPLGVKVKDYKGRLPLDLKGKGIRVCWSIALEQERKRIKMAERQQCESKLLFETKVLEEQILKLEEEVKNIKKKKTDEENSVNQQQKVPSICSDVDHINKEQKELIEVQTKELGTQGELIKKLRIQIDLQEEHLKRYKTADKLRSPQVCKIKESSEMQQREVETQKIKIKELEIKLDVQDELIQEQLKSKKGTQEEFERNIMGKYKLEMNAKETELKEGRSQIESLEVQVNVQTSFLNREKKNCEFLMAQMNALSKKTSSLTKLNENYRASIDEMTKVVNESIEAMQTLATERNTLVKYLLNRVRIIRSSRILGIDKLEGLESDEKVDELKTVLEIIEKSKIKENNIECI